MSRSFSTLSRFTTRSAQISPRAFSTSSPVKAAVVVRQMAFDQDEASFSAFFAENGIKNDFYWPSYPDNKGLGRPYYFPMAYMRFADQDQDRVMDMDGSKVGGRRLKIKTFTNSDMRDVSYNVALDRWAAAPVGDAEKPPFLAPNKK